MKHWCLTLITLLSFCLFSQAQTKDTLPAADVYANLLYSRSDMEQLKKTADSLNQRFIASATSADYYSLSQTEATKMHLSFDRSLTERLEALLKKGATLEQIDKILPDVQIGDTVSAVMAYDEVYLPLKNTYATVLYTGHAGKFETTYVSHPPSDTWIYEIKYNGQLAILDGYRLQRPFNRLKLPPEYAAMVQYTDGMMDTSVPLMLYQQQASRTVNYSLDTLMHYIAKRIIRRKISGTFINLNQKDIAVIQKSTGKNDYLKRLLNSAVKEAIEKKRGNQQLELLATDLYTADTLLLLKRFRLQVSECGMDPSPRTHMSSIALLAAQTNQWPVFIKALLNMLNDRFNSVFDSAQNSNKIARYLRTLEQLEVSSPQLLPGAMFRLSNTSSNHFQGNIDQIGCAASMSTHAGDIEAQMMRCINDARLDPYNRCVFFMLYTSYCRWLTPAGLNQGKYAALKAAINTYPYYLMTGILQLE